MNFAYMTMDPASTYVVILIFLSLVGFGLWAWFALDQIDGELGSFHTFEGMRFDIEPRVTNFHNHPNRGSVHGSAPIWFQGQAASRSNPVANPDHPLGTSHAMALNHPRLP